MDESDGPLNLVGTEASGTSVHMARSTVDNRLDTLDIGLDSTVGTSVGVGNLDTEGNALVAELTLCHFLKHLLACVWLQKQLLCCKDSFYILAEAMGKCKRNF